MHAADNLSFTIAPDKWALSVAGHVGHGDPAYGPVEAAAAQTAAELEQRAGEVLDGTASAGAREIRQRLAATQAELAAAQAEAEAEGQRAEHEAELLRFDQSEQAAARQEAAAARGRILERRAEALQAALGRTQAQAQREQTAAEGRLAAEVEQRLRAAIAEASRAVAQSPEFVRLAGASLALAELPATFRRALGAGRRQRGD